MTIKIPYKCFNLIVNNTDEGFGGNIEPNSVFQIDNSRDKFWDVNAHTLPELQVKFEKLVESKLKELEVRVDWVPQETKEGKTMMKINCDYKTYLIEITKEEDSQYFKCILIGDVYSKPLKITNESLERVLHWYKNYIDKFNTGISGHLMSLTVEYESRLLSFEYDPNINKVSSHFMFLTKKGEEGSLDKLVTRFQEEVDKESKSYIYKKRVSDGVMVKVGTLIESGYIDFDAPKHTSYYTTLRLSSKYYLNWYMKKDNHYLEVIPNPTPSKIKTYNFKEVLCIEENSEPKTIGYFTEENKVFYYDQYIEPSKN